MLILKKMLQYGTIHNNTKVIILHVNFKHIINLILNNYSHYTGKTEKRNQIQ